MTNRFLHIKGFIITGIIMLTATRDYAAVNHGTSNFWKKLVAGQHVTMVIAGNSKSEERATPWPIYLHQKLDSLFPGQITYLNIAHPRYSATELLGASLPNSIIPAHPDFLSVETATGDVADDCGTSCKLDCSLQKFTASIDTLQRRFPDISIVVYLDKNTCNDDCGASVANAKYLTQTTSHRQVIADKGLHAVDVYYDPAFSSVPCHPLDGDSRNRVVPAFMGAIMGLADQTPPTQAPAGVTAAVINDRKINLSWTAVPASADAESGIAGYAVFRGGIQLGVTNTATYSDTTVVEKSTYLYTVAAINGQGLVGPVSSSVSAVTPTDVTPPSIISALAVGLPNTKVIVTFSEPVDPASALIAANYQINTGISVSASQIVSPREVRLTNTSFVDGTQYTLTASGVKDMAAAPNMSSNATKTFRYNLYVHGLSYEYYINLPAATSVPNFDALTPYSKGIVPKVQTSMLPGMTTKVGVRYSGYINLPEGTGSQRTYWWFTIKSIGSCIEYVDNQVAINNDNWSGAGDNEHAGPHMTLTKGRHAFKLDYSYFSTSIGPPYLATLWTPPSSVAWNIPIPDSVWYYIPQEEVGTQLKIVFISPTSGSTWRVGQTMPVQWVNNIGDNRALRFRTSFDEGVSWTEMRQGSINADSGKFSWTIPTTLNGISTICAKVYIKAEDYMNPDYAVETGPFAIAAQSSARMVRLLAIKKVSASMVPGRIVISNLPAGYSVSLYDRLGRNCIQHVPKSVQGDRVSLSTAFLANGAYVLQFCSSGEVTAKMVTITK